MKSLRIIPDPDDAHEAKILACYERWLEDYSPTLWPELVALINQRSPGQVARMEQERGLA